MGELLAFLPMILGVVFIAVLYFTEKDMMRIQWNSVASFIAFMFLITFIRISGFDFIQRFDAGFLIPRPPPEIMDMGIWWFSMVWWEDAFFAIPLYWAHKKLKPILAWSLTIVLSLHFGMGHIYQGIGAALLLSIYPYYISLRYAKKVGFGTVMTCHVLYDFMTFFTIWLLPYLLPLMGYNY
jgi:hypothetical protein